MNIKQIYRIITALGLLAIVVSAFCFQNIALSKFEGIKSYNNSVLKTPAQSSDSQSSSTNDINEEEDDEDNKVEELETFVLVNTPILLSKTYFKTVVGYNNHSIDVSSPPPWVYNS